MIYLFFNDRKYENDIRALLMAFYHGEKILVRDKADADRSLRYEPEDKLLAVTCEGGGISFRLEDGDKKLLGKCETGSLPPERVAGKNLLKDTLYQMLAAVTGKKLPWGTLTGIRPTKIPMAFYDNHQSKEEAGAHLRDVYRVSEEKTDLCLQVAENEKRILDGVDYEKTLSLYIGIPFCPTICLYCSFSSYPLNIWQKEVDNYLEALFKEIRRVAGMIKGYKLTTVYMGGGTPTSLSAEQMDRLLFELEKYFNLNSTDEFTIEAGRPDSLDMDKLRVIKAHGIDRISINPQTLNEKTLDIIGRRHSVGDVYKAFNMARQAGFSNINMDLILGLPGETAEDVARTLSGIEELAPESMTVHSLAVKRASRLNQNLSLYPPASQTDINQMIHMSWKKAESMGMIPYYMYRQKNMAGNLENVGYAKPGKECLYNILIMEEKQSIIALGAGASSKIVYPKELRIERVENVKSVKDYIERIDEMIERKASNFPFTGK